MKRSSLRTFFLSMFRLDDRHYISLKKINWLYMIIERVREKRLSLQKKIFGSFFVNGIVLFPLNIRLINFSKRKGQFSVFHLGLISSESRFFIRSALNYGLDYSLYRYSPLICHAEMCLLVINGIPGHGSGTLPWKHVSCLTRILPVISLSRFLWSN